MIEGSNADRLIGARGTDRDRFLTSHRALAACAREFARLADEIVLGVAALSGATVEHKAAIRQSPDRCIVQLGPVALTLAWLRGSHDSVALGELLVIVWRGAVAPRRQHQPERPVAGRSPLPATALWEQVLAAVGDSEAEWAWQSNGAATERCSSRELAARCVERLRAAYLDSGESS